MDNPPARQQALTRFWDHNFNEVFPPQDFKYISVDCGGTRWSGLVTQRGKLRSAEKAWPDRRRGMTDLRGRIAAVLIAHPDRMDGTCCGNRDFTAADEWAHHVADAVIRELKLEVEDGECNYCHAMLPGCRYSTWTTDNE